MERKTQCIEIENYSNIDGRGCQHSKHSFDFSFSRYSTPVEKTTKNFLKKFKKVVDKPF